MPYYSLRVSIPEPCSENWAAMTPVDEVRRHCAACDKTLTDFSHMTDRQIGQVLATNGGKLCGRFRRSQLDRPLRLNGPRRRRGIGAIAASAGLLLAAPAFGQGVTPEPTEQVAARSPHPAPASPQKITLQGTVTDTSGEGLIGASILISGTTTGTVTDIDGRFSLRVSTDAPVTLEITYVGFTTSTVNYSPTELVAMAAQPFSPATTFTLEESVSGLLGGMIVVGYVRSKPSLLENLMVHSVKPVYEAPDYSHRTKSGDWKDYWRDLFAKRKARRAERRAARQARKLARQVTRPENTELVEAAAPQTVKEDLVQASFNLQASPNPFDQELRVSFSLPEAQAISLTLLDVTGRVVVQEKYRLQAGIQEIVLRQNFGNLTSGTYLLRLQGEHNGQETIRLIR